MSKLPTIRSERFAVSLKINDRIHKIFQIVFHTGKTSGKTHNLVTFPYFSDSKGLLSRLTFPAQKLSTLSISLLPEGKVTSHLVKYSHPMDGVAHFSGDGKIITSIKNQSRRLDVSHGHMFTIQMQGIEEFELRDGNKKFGDKRIDLDFEFKDGSPEAVKFVGWWFKATDLKGKINEDIPKQPHFAFREPDGTLKETGFVISPQEKSPLADFAMLLSCQAIPKMDDIGKPKFSFIGGFDQTNKIDQDMHFLGCIYPAEGYKNLLKSIGSADFTPKNPFA
ncbi:MAG: hypothetical protein HZA34_04410 [Candidatus Pacebacteria bacterium]|nr:hypothetical protein [Candidatus Paceibacterota bacterium]